VECRAGAQFCADELEQLLPQRADEEALVWTMAGARGLSSLQYMVGMGYLFVGRVLGRV
jgi:hypothetical protein